MSLTEKNSNLVSIVEKNLINMQVDMESRLLVGFSGGPDSVFLLFALHSLQEKWGFHLSAVYIDHGIRSNEERRKENEFVKYYCSSLNVPLYIKKIRNGKIRELAMDTGNSVEMVARELRYTAFKNFFHDLKCNYLVLAHNLDDNLETILMNLFQGSGISGVSGIALKSGYLIRPMLNISKDEILSFLKKKRIKYVVDSTNLKKDFLRNKIRLELIPCLKNIFPGFKKSLSNFAFKMRNVEEYFKKFSLDLYEKAGFVIFEDEYAVIDGQWFIDLHYILKEKLIYDLFDRYQKRERPQLERTGYTKRLPYRFVRDALKSQVITKHKVILDGYGYKLYWKGENLFWQRDIVDRTKKGYLIDLKDEEDCFYIFGLRITLKRDSKQNEKRGLYLFPPIVVRSFIEGDFIFCKEGKKKLKKIFNELGVKPDERWKIPVVEDKRGIAAVITVHQNAKVIQRQHHAHGRHGGLKYLIIVDKIDQKEMGLMV